MKGYNPHVQGMGRILNIIARGYLFHDKDGNIVKDDAYSRIEYAKNVLCAWRSVPDTKENSDVNFSHLSDVFRMCFLSLYHQRVKDGFILIYKV